MSWNDGHERRRFEQKQRTQANEYHKYGMNEEQIHAMYLQDLQEYRNDRIYAIHIQSTEELESDGEESRNALHKKFLLSMTCTMDMSESVATAGSTKSKTMLYIVRFASSTQIRRSF
jgi:hypothetical protein